MPTKPTLALMAAVATGSFVSPAFAQSLDHRDATAADRQVVRPHEDRAPIRISASAKAACMPDAMRLCRDAVPNVKNVLICFAQNRDRISNRCLTVLASYGL
jgi:hypothetical protein